MKQKILSVSLFVITAVVIALYPLSKKTADANVKHVINTKPKIQLAILLDTSSSMNGLIDQTRNQLWQVVNEFSKAEQNGVKPALEVAVYEYGNSRLNANTGFIRQVAALTGELDAVSEALFSLTTNGGSEYCGYAIQTAVNDLPWSRSDGDIKAIFIAGNEPFTQGPVSYKNAISLARNKGIMVNTIHAGNKQQGETSGWKEGALLAGGEYMSIDHNHKVAHVNAPQDKEIAILNKKLNDTYVPYGNKGKEKSRRQQAEDKKTEKISSALLSKRARAKASKMYENSSWDLVDAVEAEKVDLDTIKSDQLPQELQAIDKSQRKDYLKKKVAERKKIKEEIVKLSAERNKYVTQKRQELAAPAVQTMNEAVTSAIQKQGKEKNYTFTK